MKQMLREKMDGILDVHNVKVTRFCNCIDETSLRSPDLIYHQRHQYQYQSQKVKGRRKDGQGEKTISSALSKFNLGWGEHIQLDISGTWRGKTTTDCPSQDWG